MKRKEIIKVVKKYFSIEELVCKEVYDKFGEKAWDFIDTKLLDTLAVLRETILRTSLVCNDYKWGGKNQQRGLRCNRCELVRTKATPYLSMHIFGKAIDLVSKNMTAEEMRKKIVQNQHLLPYPVRIEDGVSWLHIDVNNNTNDTIYFFK